jgi:hypothetical protein
MAGPQLDWYNQRKVESVEKTGETFTIMLEGNVAILSLDENFPLEETVAKSMVGTNLIRVILSSEETRMQFGYSVTSGDVPNVVAEVVMNPVEYTISDPEHPTDTPWYPQRIQAWAEIPDEPTGRTAEGPEA